MPEEKPWESYSKENADSTTSSAPWEAYSKPKYVPHIDDFNPIPSDNSDQIESAIDFISNHETTKGGMIDVDKDILRNVMKSPNASKEQISESIAAMQSGNPYYLKNENGVMIPKQLKGGQKPPKGYNVQSIWGTQEDSNNDSWYTDLGKSIYNGVVGAVEGVADVAQMATMGITGEASTTLDNTTNALQSLKFQKDQNLDKPVYNTEGINDWTDLVDKERFDFSPSALWGTLNSVAESGASFFTGAGAAAKFGKGVQGVEKLSQLSKGAKTAAAFTGSFLQQAGDNLDDSRDAGLVGRDAASVALLKTTAQAGIDASFGIDAQAFKKILGKSEKELFKNIVSTVEKDASGLITENGFKQLAKDYSTSYTDLAKNALKEYGKDILKEGAQEAGQDFVAKSAEQLWDKMSDEEKAKFGTDAFDAKSFASYTQNMLAGLVGGAAFGVANIKAKKEYDKQAVNALKIVEGGQDKINEFKANVAQATRRGELTEQERDIAFKKIDSYEKYNEQIKDLPNISPEDKAQAFKLSFNIESLKHETNFTAEELKDLDPIAIAKIDTKKKLISDLQKDLNHILLKQAVQTETVVADKTVDSIVKEEEPYEVGRKGLKGLLKDLGVPTQSGATKTTIGAEEKAINQRRASNPKFNEVDKAGNPKFNTLRPLEKKEVLHDYFDEHPELNNEIKGNVVQAQNNVWKVDLGGGKFVQFASSIVPEQFVGDVSNLEGETVEKKDSSGMPYVEYKTPVTVKLEEIKGTKEGRVGKRLRVLNVYNSKGQYVKSIKEKEKGNSDYHEGEIEQMVALQKKGYTAPKVDFTKLAEKAVNEKELDAVLDQADKAGESIDIDKVAKKRESLKPKETKTKKSEVKPEKKEAPKTTPVEPKEAKVEDIEISDVEKNAMLAEGYDNATINKAVKEANELRKLPAKELFIKLQEKGVFNLGTGDTNVERPDVGLPAKEYNTTLNQLEKNKDTKTIEKLMNFVEDIKQTGIVKTIRGTGGATERFAAPLHRSLLENSNERGLTETEEKEKLAELEAKEAYEAQLQKKASVKGDFNKVLDVVKKSFPKVKVVMDSKIKGAAQVKGNTISINPEYAGLDSPIHEAGHILIDAIGYNNKVIQSAIKQLKTTELWKEVKKNYKDLNEEMLGKEVLAEAIGREGVGIFDKQVDQNRFKTFLSYIYDKLKQLLGIDKNIAKSLAKQIISGIGTKNLVGKNEAVQEKRRREKSENEKDIDALYKRLQSEPDLSKFNYETLTDAYNLIITADDISSAKMGAVKKELLERIGMNLTQRAINKVKSDPKFSEEKAIHKDLSWWGKIFNTLTHFSIDFPDMIGLKDLVEKASFDKTIASKKAKKIAEKLAIKVIEDRNKKLGIVTRGTETLKQLLGNRNYKYFDYMDNGNGDLITVTEAKKQGLSEAQINFLKYTREKIGEMKGLINEESHDVIMEALKMDKKFYESFQTENGVSAMSALVGNTHNINNVRIEYKDPQTGKSHITEYENIESALAKYGEKGFKEKVRAMALIIKYNFKARRQLKEQVNADQKGEDNVLNVIRKGEYSLDEKGQLRSKFNKPRDAKRPYSKDFYTALHEFIEETEHIRYMSPLVPIINSIDYINKNGVKDANGRVIHAKKENVTEWLKEWADLHVLQRPKEHDPALDATLKFLRSWTSLSTMMFNVPAQGMNLAIGLYNNWRKDTTKDLVKGLGRMFKTQDGASLAYDLIQRYGASSTDVDSNPLSTASSIFGKIGFFGTKWGEFIIQGSGLMGKMSPKDLNSFEYKTNKYGIKELEVKSTLTKEEKDALEKRILDYINEVSDVQGKYADKDRRNFMNNEVGKAIAQYKVWMPDWFLTRFGEKGSISSMVRGGFAELKKDIKEKGAVKGFWENKDFMSNLKEAMTVVLLLSIIHKDDDDKSKAVKMAEKALGDVLFIFDPNNLKWTISRPIASISKINDLLDVGISLSDMDAEKTGKKIGRLLPGKKVVDLADYLEEE